eukprot:scaffold9886_cov36-Phaeocystis_antarctica.AAC.1
MWRARAAQAADWPRRAGAWGRLWHALSLRRALGQPEACMLWGREKALEAPVSWPESGPPCFRHGGERVKKRAGDGRLCRTQGRGGPASQNTSTLNRGCPETGGRPARDLALVERIKAGGRSGRSLWAAVFHMRWARGSPVARSQAPCSAARRVWPRPG